MKSTIFLVSLTAPLLLTSCAGVSPYGGALAGTDAQHIVIEGNSQTGAYRMEATGLNQSTSIREGTSLLKFKAMGEVAKVGMKEASDIGSEVLAQ